MSTYLPYIGTFIAGWIIGMIYAAWSTYRAKQKAEAKAEMDKLLATLEKAKTIIDQKEGEKHDATNQH